MNIAVRSMLISDTAAVNKLAAQLGYPDTPEETLNRIALLQQQPNNCLLVATYEDLVIGWLHAIKMNWLETGVFVEIAGLVVDEQHRSKQAGALLLAATQAWAGQQGCDRIIARSNVLRTRAHRFYLRNGFTETKESKVFELRC